MRSCNPFPHCVSYTQWGNGLQDHIPYALTNWTNSPPPWLWEEVWVGWFSFNCCCFVFNVEFRVVPQYVYDEVSSLSTAPMILYIRMAKWGGLRLSQSAIWKYGCHIGSVIMRDDTTRQWRTSIYLHSHTLLEDFVEWLIGTLPIFYTIH